MMRKYLMLTLVASALLISACATVKGLGRDVESVGKAGEEAIN